MNISNLCGSACHECHECQVSFLIFEMGEKSSRIYIIKILFLLYIYVSSKKGELKIEFDTHDTRDTHDTLWVLSLKKLNLLTYLIPKNADFLGAFAWWHFSKIKFFDIKTAICDSKRTRNGQEKFLRREKFCSSADEQDFARGVPRKAPEKPPAAVTWKSRGQGRNESDKPTEGDVKN